MMEKKIREYEKFIAREAGRAGMSAADRERLAELHREMVANFQHERLIHLIVTLFFALFAVGSVFVVAWVVSVYGFMTEMLSLYLLALVLVILTGCYVRHYYFLENHVQGLYKYTEKLKGINEKSERRTTV